MTKVIERYHLDGFMLERYVNDSLRWMTWLDLGDEGLFILAGPCVIHAAPDVIELGPCKLRDAAEERSMDEVQQLLRRLPQWRETRWFAKHDDSEQLSTVHLRMVRESGPSHLEKC
jgi:hypothetical protein